MVFASRVNSGFWERLPTAVSFHFSPGLRGTCPQSCPWTYGLPIHSGEFSGLEQFLGAQHSS